ncbi:hypothetical protein Zmor_010369 [Zophobas morio]|uniref:Uncharacterized protein n=1 Tax=Zophobas morio TaxID=2755281 RepID=A0AA38MJX4_9CUCU|nr:hypothetical protein Zmor_010369 [Zophobas morio]
MVQQLRDHGTFNFKLTIVAVIGQKVHPTLKEYGHVDKVQGLEPADCPRCVTHFLSDGTPHTRQQVDFKRRFSINVYQLDETVRLWKSTVSRNYRRASTSESGSRYSGVFLPINKPLATL